MEINVNDIKDFNAIKLIDVREKSEYAKGHLERAVNVPAKMLIDNTELFLNKQDTYYIVCAFGSRSSNVCSNLTKKGYNVVDVKGGTFGYKGSLVN